MRITLYLTVVIACLCTALTARTPEARGTAERLSLTDAQRPNHSRLTATRKSLWLRSIQAKSLPCGRRMVSFSSLLHERMIAMILG